MASAFEKFSLLGKREQELITNTVKSALYTTIPEDTGNEVQENMTQR